MIGIIADRNMNSYDPIAFCAPEDFDILTHEPVNIIDVYNQYNNRDKRYIYSVYDGVIALRLEGGQNYLVGYTEGGVDYTQTIPHVQAVKTQDFNGIGTEINVDSTEGFTESGIINYVDYYGYYRFFKYTEKTATKFIGESQQIIISLFVETLIFQAFDFTNKTKGYVIVNNSNINIACSLTNVNEALWLYVGRYCNYFTAGYNGAAGQICRVKYIHYQNKNISFITGNISYYAFWNGSLTGVINIPARIKTFNWGGFANGQTFNSGGITKINIPSGVTSIDIGTFVFNNGVTFNFYPLVAPTIIGGENPLGYSRTGILHIKQGATGYDVAPWTNTSVFTNIIYDL